MSWWDEIQEKINSGDVLYTPGRGLQRTGKKPFRIISKDLFKLIITSGASNIPLEKQCFDKIEEAFSGNPLLWLRVASLHDREALENSVDKLIREATGSQLARGNYICAILEYCELVRYSMSGNRKGIEWIQGSSNSKPRLPQSLERKKQPSLKGNMAGKEEFNIAIVSDLHLSQGRNPRTRRYNLNEDFFFDGQFDRFLSYLEAESERRSRKWRLIIAGDMVDFLQITRMPNDPGFSLTEREKEYGLGTSLDKTVWKMKVMMDGHWMFFKALGRFLSTGNRCIIITGNHDIEWTVPEQQKAFREEMKKYLPRDTSDGNEVVSSSVEFCPWFYYVPGLIWIEHGHQYDGMNSFDYLLAPYLPNSKELMLPGGSFFVRYLFNKVEQKDPFADNIKPTSAYVRKYWLKLLCSPKIMKHSCYFLEILRKIQRFEPEQLEELRQKNEEKIQAEAERFGIDLSKLEAIRKRWVPCFIYNTSKLRNIKYFLTYEAGKTYRKMASVIQKQLGVKYVVFGHTHDADLLLLCSNEKAEYTNSGTWTKIFCSNPAERLLRDEQESVFVQILRDEKDRLELMKWRDDLGRGERVNLFE